MTISPGSHFAIALKLVCHAGAGIFLLGLAGFATSRGEETPPVESVAVPVVGTGIFPATAPLAYGDDEYLIPEVFQSHLPTTMGKYVFRLWVNPHLGDYLHSDYMRLTTGVRYGLTENWQVSVASNLYFSHGHGEVNSFDRYGAANLQIGTKVNLGQPWFSGWNIGTGFDLVFPVSRPPAELTDGLVHFMPYITFSHRLEAHPDWRIFCGLRFNVISETAIVGEFGDDAFHASSSGITGGWVIDRKNWHYTLEASYDTARLIGSAAKDYFTLRPGVIWEIPPRRHSRAKGQWSVGIAPKISYGPGGLGVGGSLRVRYNRDLKKPARRPWGHSIP